MTAHRAGPDRLLMLVLAAALPVFVLWLGANSIWDANEAFYVETPRQMVESGDYITPVFNDALRINKPVLSYWIVAALYQLLGTSVAVERLGIAAGAVGIIGAAFLIGRTWRSRTTGLLAAIIVATAPRMVFFSRRIFIDIYITLFMALTLAGFVLAERHPEHRRRYLLFTYAAIGLGVLTKGPIALVIPAIVLALWWTVEGRWRDIRRSSPGLGLAVIALIVVPWYAALVARHGWDPLRSFLAVENVERFRTSLVPGERPFWYYLPVLLGDLFPWAPLLIVPLLTAWRPAARGEDLTGASLRRLLWLWIVVFVGVFSVSRTKQDLYIFPVVPAVAALVADAVVQAWRDHERRAVRRTLVVVAALCLVAGPLIYQLFGSGYYRLPGAAVAAVLLAAGALGVLVLTFRGRSDRAVVVLAATFAAFNYVLASTILPGMERFKPVVPIARVITDRAAPEDVVGSYHMMLPSLVFYARRPVRELDQDAATSLLRGPVGAWVLTSRPEWEPLRQSTPDLCIAATAPLFDLKLRDVLADRPPPEVLLVTNRCSRP